MTCWRAETANPCGERHTDVLTVDILGVYRPVCGAQNNAMEEKYIIVVIIDYQVFKLDNTQPEVNRIGRRSSTAPAGHDGTHRAHAASVG